MDSSELKRINQENATKALTDQRHKDVLNSSVAVSNTVLSATESLIKYMEGRTSKTQVVNQLRSINTPDSLKVIPEIKALHETLKKHENTDLSELTGVMRELLLQAEKIPKELPETPEQKFIDYTKQFSALSDAVKAVEKVVKAQELVVHPPEINLPAPNVNVTPPDLKPLQTSIKDVVKAVNEIVIPEYKSDNKEVEKLIKASNKLLEGILDKPVSSGGGGGSSWTAVNPSGIPMPLNLDVDGKLITSATFTGSLTSSPTFKDDPTSAGETPKYGQRNSTTYKQMVEADVGSTITSLPLPSGASTSTNQNPLDKYKIADEDSLAATKYYGFTSTVNANTNWIILKQVVGATENQYRYANVSNNTSIAYGTATTGAWATRATLVYGYLYTLTGV